MKIFIRDLSVIEVKSGTRVRFSVTYADDNGEPVNTEIGWTVDRERKIRPPSCRSGRGWLNIIRPSDAHIAHITSALRKSEFVEENLGPEPSDTSIISDEEIDI